MDRLLESFFSFKPAASWPCRYHGGAHRQDEVAVSALGTEHATAEWRLHGNLIARLAKAPSGTRLLELSDAGWPTPTTISRLNAILWFVTYRLGLPCDAAFRLKYDRAGRGGRPEHTYVVVDGRTYRISYLALKIDPAAKAVEVEVDRAAEVAYFMNDKSLAYVRRLWYRLRSACSEALRIIDGLKDSEDGAAFSDRYWELVEESLRLERDVLCDGYGVFTAHPIHEVKGRLKDLAGAFEALAREAKLLRAERMILAA
jgi:hypothetical protein